MFGRSQNEFEWNMASTGAFFLQTPATGRTLVPPNLVISAGLLLFAEWPGNGEAYEWGERNWFGSTSRCAQRNLCGLVTRTKAALRLANRGDIGQIGFRLKTRVVGQPATRLTNVR